MDPREELAALRRLAELEAKAGNAPAPEPESAASRYGKLTLEAAGPYATAAALGAGAGAALTAPVGGLGAGPGAAMGVTALGLTDLGANLYNLASPAWGGAPIPTGSDVIRRGIRSIGGGAEPQTPAEQKYVSGVEAATAALSQANALRNLAPMLSQRAPTTANVLREMGQKPAAQTAAAIGATEAPLLLQDYTEDEPSFLRNPVSNAFASVLGGLALGTAVGKAPGMMRMLPGRGTPSTTQVREQSTRAYEQMKQAGVEMTPQSYDNFLARVASDLQAEGFDPAHHTALAAQLRKLESYRGQPRSLAELDVARSEIRKKLGGNPDPNVRRLVSALTDNLDEYITTARPQDIAAGDLNVALPALLEARRLWAAASKSDEMEELLRRAKFSNQPLDSAIRAEFQTFVKNPRKMRKFTPEEQAFIEKVASGSSWRSGLEDLGHSMQLKHAILASSTGAGLGLYSQSIDPAIGAAVGAGLYGTSLAARGASNALARRQANQAAAFMRGYRPPEDPRFYVTSPIIQNALAAGAEEQERRNALAP